jgi:hypothetical protein
MKVRSGRIGTTFIQCQQLEALCFCDIAHYYRERQKELLDLRAEWLGVRCC